MAQTKKWIHCFWCSGTSSIFFFKRERWGRRRGETLKHTFITGVRNKKRVGGSQCGIFRKGSIPPFFSSHPNITKYFLKHQLFLQHHSIACAASTLWQQCVLLGKNCAAATSRWSWFRNVKNKFVYWLEPLKHPNQNGVLVLKATSRTKPHLLFHKKRKTKRTGKGQTQQKRAGGESGGQQSSSRVKGHHHLV